GPGHGLGHGAGSGRRGVPDPTGPAADAPRDLGPTPDDHTPEAHPDPHLRPLPVVVHLTTP
ncbi:hypothetical protein, partial [Streptomyces sp. e14]|uniref:hypothetical protein n=1 Tax=Streptomyces sp. e14 TaxID=645465 RepID=UPI003FCCF104